jgi:hypothetical protein
VSFNLEGTAVGNLASQLIALGAVKDLATFRRHLAPSHWSPTRNGRSSACLPPTYIPRLYVIGADGRIKFQSVGFDEGEFGNAVAVVRQELEGGAPAPPKP